MALGIDPRAMAELEAALDAKMRPQKGAVQSNHLAEVTRVDPDGTAWIHIFGGADETPVSTLLSTVSEGEVVNAIISGGKVTVNGNASSPSASTAYVNKVNKATAETTRAAIAAILGDIVQIKKAIIDEATVEELVAMIATVQDLVVDYANINEAITGRLSANELDATYANIDFANVAGLDVGTAKMVELLANSGVFSNLVYHDGAVTGQLNAVTVNGDLINANTIRANRIIFQGTDSVTGEQNGLWYALNADGNSSRPIADQLDLSDPRYASALDGSHLVAQSVTADRIDASTLTAVSAVVQQLQSVMLLAQAVQVGHGGNVHVELRGDRFSFFASNYGYDKVPEYEATTDTSLVPDKKYYSLSGGVYTEVDTSQLAPDYDPSANGLYQEYEITASKAMPGEVAYIAVDPDTNESMFYITRAVVVKDLRFGNWKWYDRFNGNLALKWMGGTT